MRARPPALTEPSLLRAALERFLGGQTEETQESLAKRASQTLLEFRQAEGKGSRSRMPSTVSQASISRFLAGHDLSYARVAAIWNCVARQSVPNPDDMIAKKKYYIEMGNVVFAGPTDTLGDFVSRTSPMNISYAPWREEGQIRGVIQVATAVEALTGEANNVPLAEAVRRNPACLRRKAPREIPSQTTVREARQNFELELKRDPFAYIAFVTKSGKGRPKRLGLITQYDLS